jgi:hypothetical protein
LCPIHVLLARYARLIEVAFYLPLEIGIDPLKYFSAQGIV